jgi:hypothetical protein
MGIIWHVHVAMTRTEVTDPAAVRDLLRRYDTCPYLDVIAAPGDLGTLVLDTDEDGLDEWPSAVPVADLPPDDDDDDDDENTGAWFEALWKLHEDKGEQGLNDLLLDLAPYLAGPLTLQAANFSSTGEFGAAQEWTIRPGATAVGCRKIVGFDDEPALAYGDAAA